MEGNEMAKELKAGDPAPDFALKSTEGDEYRLSNLKGKNVLLYFYPRDNTHGCTAEACSFRDMKGEFDNAGAVILGVSLDDQKSHEKFRDKFTLNFPILSDTDAEVSKAYGVYKEKNNYGKKYWGIERTTFVIDKDGIIRKVYPKVKVEGHTDEVLRFIKSEL
jgi:peroxiredoxin Q/BCP